MAKKAILLCKDIPNELVIHNLVYKNVYETNNIDADNYFHR
jgi:hypothetical protein